MELDFDQIQAKRPSCKDSVMPWVQERVSARTALCGVYSMRVFMCWRLLLSWQRVGPQPARCTFKAGSGSSC